MAKPKITVKRITREQMYEDARKDGRSKRYIASLKKSMANMDFASKNRLEIFGTICSSCPIPLHLVNAKISKKAEHEINQMVAMIVNKVNGDCARTLQYVHRMPKDNLNVQMIVANAKKSEKRGLGAKASMDKLWERKDKLKKHEMFSIALGL